MDSLSSQPDAEDDAATARSDDGIVLLPSLVGESEPADPEVVADCLTALINEGNPKRCAQIAAAALDNEARSGGGRTRFLLLIAIAMAYADPDDPQGREYRSLLWAARGTMLGGPTRTKIDFSISPFLSNLDPLVHELSRWLFIFMICSMKRDWCDCGSSHLDDVVVLIQEAMEHERSVMSDEFLLKSAAVAAAAFGLERTERVLLDKAPKGGARVRLRRQAAEAFNAEDFVTAGSLYRELEGDTEKSPAPVERIEAAIVAGYASEAYDACGDHDGAVRAASRAIDQVQHLRADLSINSLRGADASINGANHRACFVLASNLGRRPELVLDLLRALLITTDSVLTGRLRGGHLLSDSLLMDRARATLEGRPLRIVSQPIGTGTGSRGFVLDVGGGGAEARTWTLRTNCPRCGGDCLALRNEAATRCVSDAVLSGIDGESCVRIAPIGASWGFPYARLRLGRRKMSTVPFALTPLGAIEATRPSLRTLITIIDADLPLARDLEADWQALAQSRNLEVLMPQSVGEFESMLQNVNGGVLASYAHGEGAGDPAEHSLRFSNGETWHVERAMRAPSLPAIAIMGSCHVGKTHEPTTREPHSLPLALLAGGTTEVVASTERVLHDVAAPLVTGVLERVLDGTDADMALAEERAILMEGADLRTVSELECFSTLARMR